MRASLYGSNLPKVSQPSGGYSARRLTTLPTIHPTHRDRAITAATAALARLFPGQATGRLDPPPRRVLVLKPCCLGDLLMATATLRALREAYPDAVIHLAVGSASQVVGLGNPRLDAIVPLGSVGSGRAPLSAYLQVARQLRAGRYDTAFTLDRSPLVGLLPWLAGIPRRVGLDSGGRGFAHTVRVPAPPAAPRHEAEVYLDTLRAVGLTPVAPRLEFRPSSADEAELEGIRIKDEGLGMTTPSSVLRPPSFILLHPAGGVNPGMTLLAKRWPAARFAHLADRLADEVGARVVLVGGPGDREVSAEVVRHARRPLLDLTGQLGFGALGALARRAALYIGNDTGATHLAVAVGAPTLMLMGPTDPRRYGPYRPTAPDTVAYVAPPDARPNDYLALRAAAHLRADSPLSIERVGVEQVYAAARQLLVAAPARG